MPKLFSGIFCCADVKQKTLDELKKVCIQCKACELSKNRTFTVFSDGNPNAKIMLIGEAPGVDEDAAGIPFVGRAGQLLNSFLEEAGFSRKDDIYICNTIKCRPPQNRIPSNEEKQACRAYLSGQIAVVRPKIILLCGSVAAKSFIKEDFEIAQIRGRWLNLYDDVEMMVIFHPAFLLRSHAVNEGSARWLMKKDLEKVKQKLVELS